MGKLDGRCLCGAITYSSDAEPIMSILSDAADIAFIKAGTLDDPSWIEPEMELWDSSRRPWVDRIEHEDRGSFARGLDK